MVQRGWVNIDPKLLAAIDRHRENTMLTRAEWVDGAIRWMLLTQVRNRPWSVASKRARR